MIFMNRMAAVFSFLLISLALPAGAQWTAEGYIGGRAGLSVFSSNWSGEEEDSSQWSVKADLTATKASDKYRWENLLRYDYGQTITEDKETTETADEIYAETVGLIDVGTFISPYAKIDIRSQTTDIADPITFTESLGLEAVLLPEKKQSSLTTRAGIAFRQSYNTDLKTLKEIGAEWDTRYSFNLKEKFKFISRGKFFTAFNAGADFRWENDLYYKLNDILTLQAGYIARHEYSESGPRPSLPDDIQTRFSMSVGISYNLFTPEK